MRPASASGRGLRHAHAYGVRPRMMLGGRSRSCGRRCERASRSARPIMSVCSARLTSRRTPSARPAMQHPTPATRATVTDVRMQGFRQRSEVDDVLAWVDANATPLPATVVDVDVACGRVLAEAVRAPIDVPAFDRSSMDGYALAGAETHGASDYNPLSFEVTGQALPGRAYEGAVGSGCAVRVMTGAPLPQGADAVVPAEYAQERDGRVEITLAVGTGKHAGARGEDIRRGDVVLAPRRKLRAQDAGLLASLGIARVPVLEQPRVRIVVTGNEIVAAGDAK